MGLLHVFFFLGRTLRTLVSNPTFLVACVSRVELAVGKMDVGGCKLTFWDLGGQVRLRVINARGLIYLSSHIG